MTVDELRDKIAGVPGHFEVIVRATDLEDNFICADLVDAGIETAHDDDDTPFFALDAEQLEEGDR